MAAKERLSANLALSLTLLYLQKRIQRRSLGTGAVPHFYPRTSLYASSETQGLVLRGCTARNTTKGKH